MNTARLAVLIGCCAQVVHGQAPPAHAPRDAGAAEPVPAQTSPAQGAGATTPGATPGETPGTATQASAPPSAQPAPAATAAPAQTPVPATEQAQAAPTAAAAPAPPQPTPEQLAAAREAYAEGQALFAQERFLEAREAFARAYATVPNPVVLISIAECDVKLGRYEDAYAGYQRYLSARPGAPDRAEIETKLQELAAIPATLELRSQPPGARVLLDGRDSGQVTPAELSLARGEHTLRLEAEGYQPLETQVTARIGARHELTVELTPLPPPPPPLEVAQEAEPQAEPPTTALWVASIVGAAGLVGGTVLGFMALAEHSDYDANPTQESADRGERLALFADVAFGVGAMAVITGTVLFLTADDAPDSPAAGATQPSDAGGQTSLRITPVLAPRAAALSARLEF